MRRDLLNVGFGGSVAACLLQPFAKRVLFGRERHELLVPERHAIRFRKGSHRVNDRLFGFSDVIDLTVTISDMFSYTSGWCLL